MRLSRVKDQIWWRIIVIAVTALLTYKLLVMGRPWVPWWFIRTVPVVFTIYILAYYFGRNKWKLLQIILPITAWVICSGYSFYLLSIDERWHFAPISIYLTLNVAFQLLRSDRKPDNAPIKD
ncbi:MAG: hypothetical protein ACYC27_03620 [Armatimonadota bacterium]